MLVLPLPSNILGPCPRSQRAYLCVNPEIEQHVQLPVFHRDAADKNHPVPSRTAVTLCSQCRVLQVHQLLAQHRIFQVFTKHRIASLGNTDSRPGQEAHFQANPLALERSSPNHLLCCCQLFADRCCRVSTARVSHTGWRYHRAGHLTPVLGTLGARLENASASRSRWSAHRRLLARSYRRQS